ncbi:MAG: hypothetical protein LUQ13_02700 [Methanomicrobiales archaeon]|nr:hypothetical protein [Methanomicrobiales archaeon]
MPVNCSPACANARGEVTGQEFVIACSKGGCPLGAEARLLASTAVLITGSGSPAKIRCTCDSEGY